jgi:outer membrane receptor protein involved in Fe transport
VARAALAASAMTGAGAARAQVAAPDGVLAFPAGYFAASHPADAYDMVRRLPGIDFDEGDDEVRGFAGGRGNVVIDGRPPSSKQESLEELLRRIPASGVERIELIRGGARGIDMAGHDVVANVVRARTSRTRGAAEAGAERASGDALRPNLRLEGSRESGDRRIEGVLAMTTEVDDESGEGSLTVSDPDGTVVENDDRSEWEVERTWSGSGEYETPLAGGTLAANASLARASSDEQVLTGGELARELEQVWRGEIGGRFHREIAGTGQIDLLLLQRLSRLRSEATESDESFREATDTSETVARVDFRRENECLGWNASLEGALNGLESEAALQEGGVAVPLPGSDADVAERRAEAAIGAVWRPRAGLVVEPSLRAEWSSIRAAGDAGESLSLFYWKPRLAGSYSFGSSQLRLTFEREVGQLDFTDFVASASLDRDEVSAGAESLRPPQTWSATAAWEQRFWGDGALILSYRHEWIDDVIDRSFVVRDGETFDAVANIGAGTRDIGEIELTVPFARFGVPGLQVRGSLTLIHSRVTDPTTGLRRIISEDRPVEGELHITHDLPGGRWSWGADFSLAHHERQFRFDEERLEQKQASLGLYVEFRPSPEWRLRLGAENIFGRTIDEVREKYEGPRSSFPLDSVENLRIDTAPIVAFSIRRAFGGT